MCCDCFEVCFVTYLVALAHETGHLVASKILGYSNNGIRVEPFGVCLKLNNNISDSLHEFFISMAGPFVNFIMIALGTVLAYWGVNIPETFFISNFYMLFINLLPVMPLDGGRIIKSVLKMEIGEKKAQKILKYISVPVVCVLAVFGVVLLFKSKINASLLLASIFMCNNIKITGNKSMDIASMYDFEISCDNARVYYINADMTVKNAIKVLPFEELCIVFVVADYGEALNVITNKYILNLSGEDYFNRKISDI